MYILPIQSGVLLNVQGVNQALQNFDVNYTYTPTPGLIVRVSGGGIRSYQFAYTAAASMEKRVGGFWVTAGYQRYLSFFGPATPIGAGPSTGIPFSQGVLPNSVYQVASAGLKGKLGKRVSAEVTLLHARNEAGFQNGNIRSWVGRCRVNYKLTGPFVLFTQLEFYQQNLNEFTQLPLSRQRYFGGVEIVLSRRREALDIPNHTTDGEPDADQSQMDGPAVAPRDN